MCLLKQNLDTNLQHLELLNVNKSNVMYQYFFNICYLKVNFMIFEFEHIYIIHSEMVYIDNGKCGMNCLRHESQLSVVNGHNLHSNCLESSTISKGHFLFLQILWLVLISFKLSIDLTIICSITQTYT